MALIKWDKTLSVNVQEIDSQHQRLIELINQLHSLMMAGQGKDAVGLVLEDLVDYTKTHFSFEEKLFAKFNYEHTKEHILEHKKLAEKVIAFQNDFKAGKATVTLDVMNFLKDWLTNHIKGTDKKYSKCFNDNGMN